MAYYRGSELSGTTYEGAVTSTGTLFSRRPGGIADDIGTVMSYTSTIILPSGVNFALNDVVELLWLPSDHVPIDYVLTADQFDTNAANAFAIQLGVMTGTPGDTTRTQTAVGSDGGTAIKIAGATTLSTTKPGWTNGSGNNAYAVQNFAHTLPRVAPVFNADRTYGLAVTAAAGTNPATIRRLDFTLFTRVARYGS